MTQYSPLFDYLVNPSSAVEARRVRRLIDDMDFRIRRQRRRVETISTTTEGPADEMRALLKDMIDVRDLMQAQIDTFTKSRGTENEAVSTT